MRSFESCVTLAAVILAVAGCADAARQRREALVSEDPEERVAYLKSFEFSESPDRGVSEAEIGSDIDRSIGQWPEDWRFHAFKASHFVRTRDMSSARTEHEEAKRLYEADPYVVDPVVGTGHGLHVRAGLAPDSVGGLAGELLALAIIAITDAAVEDVAEPYPAAPSSTTWFPRPDAYPRSKS